MTRIELIILIGDVLTKLDVLRGSFPPDHPMRNELDSLRNDIDDGQRELTKAQFDENTAAFKEAADKLAEVNADLKETIRETENVVETIANLRRFLSAVESIVGVAVPFVV